jgi:hypothetical protein
MFDGFLGCRVLLLDIRLDLFEGLDVADDDFPLLDEVHLRLPEISRGDHHVITFVTHLNDRLVGRPSVLDHHVHLAELGGTEVGKVADKRLFLTLTEHKRVYIFHTYHTSWVTYRFTREYINIVGRNLFTILW